jgi:hypothetical protein
MNTLAWILCGAFWILLAAFIAGFIILGTED